MTDTFTVDAARAVGGPDWLVERRLGAAERLGSVSWPTPDEEIWRYSRIDELDLERFTPAGADTTVTAPADVAVTAAAPKAFCSSTAQSKFRCRSSRTAAQW